MKRKELVLGMLVSLALVAYMVMALPVMASECETIKTVEPLTPNKYYVGDIIHYVMNVTNPSGNPYTNNYSLVEDTLPDSSIVTLATDVIQAPGDTDTYTYDYTVDELDLQYVAGRYRVYNTLHVVGTDTHGDVINDSKSWNSIILRPEISIEKTVDCNNDSVFAHQEQTDGPDTPTWRIVVTNTGYDPVYNITVSDTNGRNWGPFNLINPGDHWEAEYDGDQISETTTNTATASGHDEIQGPVGPVSDSATNIIGTTEVGGTAFLVDKSGLLAPWAVLLVCAGIVGMLVLRKRRGA